MNQYVWVITKVIFSNTGSPRVKIWQKVLGATFLLTLYIWGAWTAFKLQCVAIATFSSYLWLSVSIWLCFHFCE